MRKVFRAIGVASIAGSLAVVVLVPGARPVTAGTGHVYVVNSTADTSDANVGDHKCDFRPSTTKLDCTLRAAIQEANDDAAQDIVHFSFPGTAVRTIAPGTWLPYISEPLVIDGYSAPGASVNDIVPLSGDNAKLKIVLTPGFDDGGEDIQGLMAGAPITVKGLNITGWTESIDLEPGSAGSLITGNFLGTDVTGLNVTLPGSGGLWVYDTMTFGGSSPAARNVIVNGAMDLFIPCAHSGTITVQNNLIGIAANGHSLPNTPSGVAISVRGTSAVTIGGTAAGQANAFGAVGTGVRLTRGACGASDTTPDPHNVRIQGNTFRGTSMAIDLSKSFGGLGDGVTPNDRAPDSDKGPNRLQNFPVVKSAVNTAGLPGKTTVKGSLTSARSRSYRIEFFVAGANTQQQAVAFLGATNVTTNTSGVAGFTVDLPRQAAGKVIVATATDITFRETSEFSQPRTVTSP